MRQTTWRLFLFFQCLYALTSSGNAFRVPDEFEVYYQVEHLIDAGDLSVPQAVPSGRFFGRVGVDGRPWAPYGPGSALLAVPHHLAARAVAAIAGIPRESVVWTFVVSGLTMLSTSTGAALAVAGFHRAALGLGSTGPTALLLSMLLGGATVLWAYGTSFYSEGWQAAALIWAAALLMHRKVAAAAVLLIAAGLIKVTCLVFTPGFVIAVLVDRRITFAERLRAASVLAAGIACAVAVHMAWNVYRFGNIWEVGYDWAETVPVPPAQAFSIVDLPRGVAVLLLSPGKSLFLWAPPILLGLARLRTLPVPLFAGLATTAAVGIACFAAYLFPEGGYAHGPRHLVPLVPLMLLAAAVPGKPLPRASLAACAAAGLAIAVLSSTISFLQDQALGNDLKTLGYYERIDPNPGRAWNRYQLGYVPFVRAIGSGEWPSSRRVGAGVDLFAVHLWRARDTIADARVIPGWLPFLIVFSSMAGMAASARGLWRGDRRERALACAPQSDSIVPAG